MKEDYNDDIITEEYDPGDYSPEDTDAEGLPAESASRREFVPYLGGEDNLYDSVMPKQESRMRAFSAEEYQIRREPKKKSPLRFIIPAVLAVILAAAAVIALQRYMLVGGRFYPRHEAALDITDRAVTAESYEKLRAELPECAIRWNVPFGTSYFASDSESVTLPALAESELPLLEYFTALRELDITAIDADPAFFESVRAHAGDAHVRWRIPIGNERYESDSESIRLAAFEEDEAEKFLYFDSLRTADGRSCTCYEAILAAQRLLPECEFLYNVELGGELYAQDSVSVTVNGTRTSFAELDERLQWLPALESVSIPYCALNAGEQETLTEKYPSVRFTWPVVVAGKTFSSDDTVLSFADSTLTAAGLREIRDYLPRFFELQTVDLTGCTLTDEQVLSLCADCGPDIDVIWDFTLFERKISAMDTEIDLSGIEMTDSAALEALLPHMHHLEKVILCDCGLSDEQMAALNEKYEPVRFVWTLHISDYYHIRTDAVGFIGTGEQYGYFTAETIQRLRYCEDMEALDLGSRINFSCDLAFLTGMPKLRFLLLGEAKITDITPIGELHELEYLELNYTEVKDLSPLANCKKLLDLNVAFNSQADPKENFSLLSGMTQLERLRYSSGMIAGEDRDALAAALPGTEIEVIRDPLATCGGTWREHPRYYEMRDLLGTYYMDASGRRVDYKIVNGERVELDA